MNTATPKLVCVGTINTDGISILATPYQMGRMAARDGDPFAPEMFYARWSAKYEFAIGFLDIRPDCEPAQAFAGEYEDAEHNLAHAEEPAWKHVNLDFAVPF